MYTDIHIAALLSTIAEQRARITKLEGDLDLSEKEANRNWRWWQEEEAKVKELTGRLALAANCKDFDTIVNGKTSEKPE